MVYCDRKQEVESMKRRLRKTDDQVCETWKIAHASKVLGVSEKSFRKLLDGGQVPVRRVGRLILIPRQAFLAWINTQQK
jgi:excisionase family DNA binding protein